MGICKNCHSETTQNYCPNCGQPAILKRIDGKYILEEIRGVLNFEKGILFTVRELALNPGDSIVEFLNESRNRLVKPIVFLLITSLIYTIANSTFQFEDGYINYGSSEDSATGTILGWIQANYGYANIFMAFFIALWLKLFFKKYQFNFYEILILLFFIMGMAMLIYSIFGVVESLVHIKIMRAGAITALIYTNYAVGQFFDKRKIMSYVKGFFAYLLGMISFSLTAIAIGIIIDLIIQK